MVVDDGSWSQPPHLLMDQRGRLVGVEGDVDDAGEQAGEIDDDPLGRMRADVRESVAAGETGRFELAGVVEDAGEEPTP